LSTADTVEEVELLITNEQQYSWMSGVQQRGDSKAAQAFDIEPSLQ
jgi:hypothetical protein